MNIRPSLRSPHLALSLVTAALAWASPAAANDSVIGTETRFTSPNGLVERCVRIAPIPGGSYSDGDLEDEAAYCAIDLYSPAVALCPKTWSTSPGMIVFDISGGPYAMDRSGFERNACREGHNAEDYAADQLAKFKPTMNADGTSGTFSTSSLMYYHLSRYFDATVRVPVSVWRSMDAQMHLNEVALPGLSLTGHGDSGRMIHTGWQVLVAAEQAPASYQPTDELFTSDRAQIYGIMVSSPGHRYGPVVNGTRQSGWGAGQNRDFQETPPFLALRSELPLADAIEEGLRIGLRDPLIARDVDGEIAPQQMAYWMREISEIVLFDFIFSQQDRVGNIDFQSYWYWLDESGTLQHTRTSHHDPSDGTVPADAILIHRTNLNDNDAGGRVPYANFAKSTGMLEALRHFDGGHYTRLMALNADLQSQGPVYQWFATSLGLSARQLRQVVVNTELAAGILRDSCEQGRLRFDLNPREFFETGTVVEETVDCAG